MLISWGTSHLQSLATKEIFQNLQSLRTAEIIRIKSKIVINSNQGQCGRLRMVWGSNRKMYKTNYNKLFKHRALHLTANGLSRYSCLVANGLGRYSCLVANGLGRYSCLSANGLGRYSCLVANGLGRYSYLVANGLGRFQPLMINFGQDVRSLAVINDSAKRLGGNHSLPLKMCLHVLKNTWNFQMPEI